MKVFGLSRKYAAYGLTAAGVAIAAWLIAQRPFGDQPIQDTATGGQVSVGTQSVSPIHEGDELSRSQREEESGTMLDMTQPVRDWREGALWVSTDERPVLTRRVSARALDDSDMESWQDGERVTLKISDDLTLEGVVAMNVLRDDGGRAVRLLLGELDEDNQPAGEFFGNLSGNGAFDGFIRYRDESGVYRMSRSAEADDLNLERIPLDELLCSFDARRPDGMLTPEEATVPQAVVPATTITRPIVPAGEAVISIGDVRMAEGQTKGNVMKFTVVSGVPSGAGKAAISFQWSLVNGTAIVGSDFRNAKGKVTLAKGKTEAVISVTTIPDRVTEGNETFKVVLSSPVNAAIRDGEGEGVILDDEWTSTIAPASIPTISEPDGDVAKKTVVRSLNFVVSPAVSEAVTFSWKPNPGTATTKDYKAASGTVKLAVGQSAFTIPITVLGDGLREDDETLNITFSRLPVMLSAPPVTVTIAGSEPVVANPDAGSPVPLLESKPGAQKVLFLEFDGATVIGTAWNKTSAPIVTPSVYSKFGDKNCREIWAMVAEAYGAFDVNVTTSRAVFHAAPIANRTWCLFTIDSAKFRANGAAGLAYVDAFGSPALQPALVFCDANYTTDSFGTIAVHELGHNLGLSHDGQGGSDYYSGHDGGKHSWGPWMGAPYYRFYRQFSRGEYQGATRTEDDLQLISRYLAVQRDESADTLSGAPTLPLESFPLKNPDEYAIEGIITTRDDVDSYRLVVSKVGTVTLTVSANQEGSYSLNPGLAVYTELGIPAVPPIAGWTEEDGMLSWTGVLLPGTYRVEIRGLGDPVAPGFTDYGSIGYYALRATIR